MYTIEINNDKDNPIEIIIRGNHQEVVSSLGKALKEINYKPLEFNNQLVYKFNIESFGVVIDRNSCLRDSIFFVWIIKKDKNRDEYKEILVEPFFIEANAEKRYDEIYNFMKSE